MKRNFLVVTGLIAILVGNVFASGLSVASDTAVEKPKITIEQARAIALKKIAGTLEEEFPMEDEGKIIVYVFFIRDAKKKVFEVQVEPEKGVIIYAEENKEYGT